jgi:hypothetical protein
VMNPTHISTSPILLIERLNRHLRSVVSFFGNMSFGFGLGDFLAALELANKVRQKWNDAPEEYNTTKDE